MNMKKIVINGGKTLSGEIKVSGAKNSVVALIPASILTDENVTILNVPSLSDTENLKRIITLLGGCIEFGPGILKIDGKNVKSEVIPEEFSNKLRASYYFMGALLARFKHVEMYFPGGCKIGARPIDIHIKAFKALGTKVRKEGSKYILDAKELKGANIYLDFPSVGATVNTMLASSLAKGTTIIENAAKEPEIINVASLLNNMGAKISGAGTDTIKIEGVEKLHGATIETIPDRIVAGTYIMMGALAGEKLKVSNMIPTHIGTLLAKLRDMGVKLEIDDESVTVSKAKELKPVDIKTLVYPGFVTDLGQMMCTVLTQANGECIFEETIYENRTGHYPELIKMGANIEYTNKKAHIFGPTHLKGTNVCASDLRAGAALIIAGLVADGTTKIENIEHILRGYENIVENLKSVGADIKLIEED